MVCLTRFGSIKDDELPALARTLESQAWIGVDTEFLRERTFFPKLCLLQLAAGGRIWCVDTLRIGSLDPLMAALTAAAARKVIHAARQDLEAVYLSSKRIVAPVFDTQIAAGCIGLKPQIGYAELVKTLLDVTVPKGQTRTDWSKRPLTREQLDYAADDVLYLGDVADHLPGQAARTRARALGCWRTAWRSRTGSSTSPTPSQAWVRLRGLAQLRAGGARAGQGHRHLARKAGARPRSAARLDSVRRRDFLRSRKAAAPPLNDSLAASLQGALEEASKDAQDQEPSQDARPTPEQKAVIERLGKIVDARAAELEVSAEILAPRGELKALAMGQRDSHALTGWRREEIGTRLLEAMG